MPCETDRVLPLDCLSRLEILFDDVFLPPFGGRKPLDRVPLCWLWRDHWRENRLVLKLRDLLRQELDDGWDAPRKTECKYLLV